MKSSIACVLLASLFGTALCAGKAESLILPTFAPPSPPPPPLAGFGCPALELAIVLHQYSHFNYGADESNAVCKAIREMTAYKYAKCEFVYRYGYRASSALPALLAGVIPGPDPSTVVFLSVKFAIPQLPNQQVWYSYAERNRTKLMAALSYQPDLAAAVQKAIDWKGKVSILENCAAFMYGYEEWTTDPFEEDLAYWSPHPSPPDVLPSSPNFVPTPPFIYFGGMGCPCYYDYDILDEDFNVITTASDFKNPSCQVFLNSDNNPASKYYNFPDSYWSATSLSEDGAYGMRGCLAVLPDSEPVKCTYKGTYAIESQQCPGKLLSTSSVCSVPEVFTRTASQAKGARKEWVLNSIFSSSGMETTVAPIKANRNCPVKYLSGGAGKLTASAFKFKIMPVGNGCDSVHLYATARSAASKYLGMSKSCAGLKFTGDTDAGAVFKLRKLR